MKLLVLLAIILILVLGALIAYRMTLSANRKKEEWRKLKTRANLAEAVVRQLDKEISVAKLARTGADLLVLEGIIEEYQTKLSISNDKELTR